MADSTSVTGNLAQALAPTDTFARRHLGPREADIADMLTTLGYASLDELTDRIVPSSIRADKPLDLASPARGAGQTPRGEAELLAHFKQMMEQNVVARSCIGMGYYDTLTPAVIQRNILENPGWYTQYTPYQAEIAQGRLEALLNFQTMVADLTGLPLANASLLDEGTAAAEAMSMCLRITRKKSAFFVSDACHPQTIAVMKTRARFAEVELIIGPIDELEAIDDKLAGALVQYPDTYGTITSPDAMQKLADRLHDAGAMLVVATDLLALTLITPPGEWGADIAVGSAQRFGVPMGFGGPHAAFMSTHEKHARKMPGRIVGVSQDKSGNRALRLAIQTREQHIRRDKATSNICTAQVLLAIMAGMYAVYHGPKGLRKIATAVHSKASALINGLRRLGYEVPNPRDVFDTVRVDTENAEAIVAQAAKAGVNLRLASASTVTVSFDETTTADDLVKVLGAFNTAEAAIDLDDVIQETDDVFDGPHMRTTDYLSHPVFNTHHSETEMLRYITKLQSRDLSLAQSMIPLGSCTMKLNATSEMLPVTWEKVGRMHPFAPSDQTAGYQQMFQQLEDWLAEITGFAAVSLQPNAGSQGEYAGLLAIAAYHEANGQPERKACLIPVSAHGTNPASAVMAGFEVVPVDCDPQGNIDVADLRAKAEKHAETLGALMITYPSTHGVFEESVADICAIVHEHGGQVYMDGANMNAQVALTSPGRIGADVCHLNLHKTFCIPHGGGGPGMGPIGVVEHLKPYLPAHPFEATNDGEPIVVSAAPFGSPSILPISWVYIALMGSDGLKQATQVAILNANYMAKRLEDHYPVLFRGRDGLCAHEFILDCRQFHVSASIEVEDIAKRLIDYGFHAPTMSWPVAGTLMIEPTESEPKAELDRFCDAMIAIRNEIAEIEQANADAENNVLKHAPHSLTSMTADSWPHPYTREQAAYPAAWLKEHKFWPPVDRIDNPYGDRHLVCSCPPMESFAEG